MRARSVVPLALLLLLAATGALAETVEGLPVHITRFESGAIRVWVGDHVSTTATVAIPTSKGLIVVDTTGEPRVDRELRRIIARELGRDDFVMLINTHEHEDHVGGNEVYADCEIVGHELVAAAMAQQGGNRQQAIDWGTRRIGELEQQIAGLAEGAPEAPRLREELAFAKLRLASAQAGHRSVPPTKTFADRLNLAVGDTQLELYYIGGMHSSSDIAVLVPKQRLLLTGDTMADVWLTETPGCLASFGAHPGVRHDFPLLLKNWNLLLGRQADVGTIVTGHWNGEMTWPGFAARVKYIDALWAGVQRMAAAGSTVDAVQTEYALQTRFPELVQSRGCSAGGNRGTIREMWGVLTGQRYASDELSALIRDDAGFAAAVDRIRAKSPTYYFDEPSLNGVAYWLMQIGMVGKATEVFRLNVELFPQSWNAHDSLAEGLLTAGDREGAIASYERSLQLNPDNGNGRQMLEQIRSGVANPTPLRPGQS
ncbi:MAG: MBL fold metallo-hydrolase [Candidatus Krumholzibacteriia bacterium]